MIDRCVIFVARTVSPRLLGMAFLVAAGLVVLAGASLVTAQRGGSGERPAPAAYQGCVNTYTGVLRIVTGGQSCEDHELAIELGASGGDAALLERIETLETDNEALETRLAALEGRVSTCMTPEEVDGQQHPDVVFEGCNIHVRNGSGATNGAVNGLGNLIVGYNESNGDTRTGSHNVVIGPRHSYTSYGGLVVGRNNAISGNYSSVSGGSSNTAEGNFSSVSGGANNTASANHSNVSGGQGNLASGNASSVSGGNNNTASSGTSTVSGGQDNTASGGGASVNGGRNNIASARGASISGGNTNTASARDASVSGGLNNTASNPLASVSGGNENTASGLRATVGGGTGLIADETDEFVPFTPQQSEYEALQTDVTSLEAQVPDCLSTSGTEVYFTGCNVNVRSGSGATDGAMNGLGNLIVGYNELDEVNPDTRTGSHNLVVGPSHTYTSYGGLVAGANNRIGGEHASVTGGASNWATGRFSSISGGIFNTAFGFVSSISGGYDNQVRTEDEYSSIGGGAHVTTSASEQFLP